ncbi:MAG TPA: alpha/beta hydrolase [Solirubrobacteraceae bacterium]|nr:alpha/beta hydrolase [Solirubrobacteraceae bacterium]
MMNPDALVSHRQLKVNGIELHVAEFGSGPPVILCHGFPELWYSWRHQLPALAEAGYRAVAPDMRGYGQSSIPIDVDAYDLPSVCDDMLGLLDELGEEQAVFIGHDWGASVVWQLALAHPARVAAVVGMSVPFTPRSPAPPVELLREALGEDFYIVWFQQPKVADAALSRDVRRTLTTRKQWTRQWMQEDDQPPRPTWLTEEDLGVYVKAFERTGFTGGLNYYRNIDRNWQLTAHLAERRIEQPALFLSGSRDPVRRFMPAEIMDGWVTDLREKAVVEGAGHWVQQERPGEVNAALLRFLDGVFQAASPKLGCLRVLPTVGGSIGL